MTCPTCGSHITTHSDEVSLYADYLKRVIADQMCIEVEWIDEKSKRFECEFSRCMFYVFMKKKYPLISLQVMGRFIAWNPTFANIHTVLRRFNEFLMFPSDKRRLGIYREIKNNLPQ